MSGIPSWSQTQVDLRTQTRNVDFSSAVSTKPVRMGGVLPASCSPGEAFFLTSAAAGQNLYLCATQDLWTAQGSNATAGSAVSGIGPGVAFSDAVTLGIGENCSLNAPCNARVGGTSYAFLGPSTLTLSGGSPTVRIYISDGSDGAPPGTLKVRNSAANGVACSGACVVENQQSSFPGTSIPLAMWTATVPGAWDSTGTDLRSALSASPMAVAGTGILITQGTTTTVSIDPAVVTRKFGGSGPPASVPGSTSGDLYVDTANNNSYQCMNAAPCGAVGAGNWVQVTAGSGTPINTSTTPKKYSGTGAPGAIAGSALGDLYLDVPANDTYQCFQAGGCTAAGAGNWVKVNAGANGDGGAATSGAYSTVGGNSYFGLYAVSGLPDAASFSWVNQPAGSTMNVTGGHAVHALVPPPSANSDNLAVIRDNAALSATSFTISASLLGCTPNTAVNYSTCGIGLTDGTKVLTFGWTNVYGGIALAVMHWPNVTSPNGFATWRYWNTTLPVSAFRISLAGGVLTFSDSVDGGQSYDAFFSESVTAFFSAGAGLNACWTMDNNWSGGTGSATLMSWSVN